MPFGGLSGGGAAFEMVGRNATLATGGFAGIDPETVAVAEAGSDVEWGEYSAHPASPINTRARDSKAKFTRRGFVAHSVRFVFSVADRALLPGFVAVLLMLAFYL